MTPSVVGTVRRVAQSAALLLVLGGCGGRDGGSTAPVVPTTGALVVVPQGLPSSLTAMLQLQLADGTTRTALAGDTVRMLPPGTTTVQPASASQPDLGRWVPVREALDVIVVAGRTATDSVPFVAAPSRVTGVATGLPTEVTAPMRLLAPDGTAYDVNAGAPFITSQAGTWTVQGLPTIATGYRWQPADPPVQRLVLPGDSMTASIGYVATSGAAQVTATGLPDGLTPVMTLRQGSDTRTRTGPGVVADLAAGAWQLSGGAVSAAGVRYEADAPVLVSVSAGATSAASLTYRGTPSAASFWVERAHLTQVVQLTDGSAPLVAGREALLRVFLRASEPNTWRPSVRVTFSVQGAPYHTVTIPPPAQRGVDTIVTEGQLASSWNVRIDGGHIVPDMRVLVEADPDWAIVDDGDRLDNIWPRDGVPHGVAVRTVPTWRLVLVPIINGPDSLLGRVTTQNADQFTGLARRLLPIQDLTVRVRAPYSTSAGELQANDGNGAWLSFLSELNLLRLVEGVAGEYWYGVARVRYTSGIAGYGYVPGRAAVGWDHLPSGERVAAHEWGHNFGRRHAPCGGVSGADPAYPHAGGAIGSWGWNPATGQLVAPTATDLMGYCSNQWISAFNWSAMVAYRATTANAIVATSRAAPESEGSLLVWGQWQDGRLQLEPAFYVDGVLPVDEPLPAADRMLRVEALDANGRTLAAITTPAARVDHAAGDARAFAARLPLTRAAHAAMVSLRVHDVRSPLLGAMRRRSDAGAALARAIEVEHAGAQRARVRWRDARVQAVLVRDAVTGEVLALRRSAGDVVSAARALDVIVSDGVHSRAVRLPAR